MPKNNITSKEGLSDFDETVLYLTRPYAIITLVCLGLSLFCMIYTRNDTKSTAFVLSVCTFVIDSLFLILLIVKAKRVRRK